MNPKQPSLDNSIGRFTPAPDPKADKPGGPKGFEAGGEPRPAPARPEAMGRRHVTRSTVKG